MNKETKIPTIEDMENEALKIAENIPHLREKQKFMVEARGLIIEFSIIIEKCFNQLITETGKDLVFDYENRGLYLIKGIRNKKNLPSFKTKSSDMKKLIELILPDLEDDHKQKLLDTFNRFEAIRGIFAHVPVNWNSKDLEFIDNAPYKHFFKLNSEWRNVYLAHQEFVSIFEGIIRIILVYNRQVLLKQEIFSLVLLGKSQAEIQKEQKK